jgi:hypothetical protein
MIDKSVFFISLIWYLYNYGPPPVLIQGLIQFYNFCDEYFTLYRSIIYPTCWWVENESNCEKESIVDKLDNAPLPIRYENKYLDDIRTLSKEWVFTPEENIELTKYIEHSIKVKVDEKPGMNEEIIKLENNYQEIQTEQEIKSELIKQDIINKKLDSLANCFVIEKTPIGNVIMIYQKNKESFTYYADCNIPYRYLEVVARKYVKFFNCRPIFIDMEEELQIQKNNIEKEELKKEELKKEELKKEENMTSKKPEIKKQIFAKFKSYNKDVGCKISMAAPPKNSIPNKNVVENSKNEKMLLKEKANRYTYEGKFANFNFLQKVEKKVFNEKLRLSFADFKKINKNK